MPDAKHRSEPVDPTVADKVRNEEFLRLYTTAQRRIHAFVSTFVANPADVDEVMQETSIILWRKFAEFRSDADFTRWACGVAKLEVLRLRRTTRSVLPLEDDVLERIAAEQLDARERLDARHEALEDCLEKLRPVDRELVRQCYESGQTSRAVAEELGRPVDAVYQSLHRIRRVLHECIDRAVAAEERLP